MKSSQRTLATVALGLWLGATAASAVVIVFKDGSKEIIADSYRVEGDHLIAILPSGLETAIPLEAVDLEKTEAMAKVAKGSVIVLETEDNKRGDAAPERDRTLRDLMKDRESLPEPASGAAAPGSPHRTPAGNVDFFTVPRRPVAPAARGEAIATLLQGKGMRDARAYQGTTADRVLIDVVTASRGSVFSALEACAAVLIELRASNPDVAALELAMATSSRSRAGQFVLTPEQAQSLQSGATTPGGHFLANVLF
jgi:hypothetical protein